DQRRPGHLHGESVQWARATAEAPTAAHQPAPADQAGHPASAGEQRDPGSAELKARPGLLSPLAGGKKRPTSDNPASVCGAEGLSRSPAARRTELDVSGRL